MLTSQLHDCTEAAKYEFLTGGSGAPGRSERASFYEKAGIRNGEKVLINGAGGSIGTFAVQIAKVMGAEVTAVESTIKEAFLRRIGADHFFDSTREEFTDSGQTYDVIFNMVAGSSYSKCVNSLNPGGRYLIGNPRLSEMPRSVTTSRFTNKTAIFAFADIHMSFAATEDTRTALAPMALPSSLSAPLAAWLLGSALIGLVGIKRKK